MQKTSDGSHKKLQIRWFDKLKILSADEDMLLCYSLKLDNTLNSPFMQTN